MTQMGFSQKLLMGAVPKCSFQSHCPLFKAEPRRVLTPKDPLSFHPSWIITGRNSLRRSSPALKRNNPILLPLCVCPAQSLLCLAPCPGNLCCSPDVQWVFWQDLPGNLYLLAGKTLFRAPSSERRETHLTPTTSACCRQRTQTLHAAGTRDATQTKKKR